MLKALGHEQVEATWIWEDDQGATGILSNAWYNARTKHVEIRHYFIQENVTHDIITFKYKSTVDQIADMITKALKTYLLQKRGIGPKNIQ